MTANLSSFLRAKYDKNGPQNEDQDLQGFDATAVGQVAAAKRAESVMGTITEDDGAHEEHGAAAAAAKAAAAAAAGGSTLGGSLRSNFSSAVGGGGGGSAGARLSPPTPVAVQTGVGGGTSPEASSPGRALHASISANGRASGGGSFGGSLRDMLGIGSRSAHPREHDAADAHGGA
eukprot:365190-Chlamydomonas_euryale.AAC.1